MAMVYENPSLVIAIGTTMLFLLLGTIAGFIMNWSLGKRKGSAIPNIRNIPFTSASELKSYLYSLEFEKSLTAEALTRVSEAMNRGKISPLEYDRLILQYDEKFRTFEKEIAELRATSDFFELQTLRNDLNYFLNNKMKQLDDKLSHLSNNEIHLGSGSTFFRKFVTRGNRGSTGQTREPTHFFSRRTQTFRDQEKKLLDTQKEIMMALDRMKSEDFIEKDAGVQTFDGKNKDALASFG